MSIPAGTISLILYRVSVYGNAPPGTGAKIINVAAISGTELANTTSGSETVLADQVADFSILNAFNATTVVENGQVVHAFTLQNTEPALINACDLP